MGFGIKTRLQTHLHAIKMAYQFAPLTKRLFINHWYATLRMAMYRSPKKGYLRNGLVLEGDPHTSMVTLVRDIFEDSNYTPEFLPILPDDIVVDIGANIGVFALHAARSTQNRILAYEPDPGCFTYLQKNIQANGYSRVEAFNQAVADETGTVKLFLFKNPIRNSLWDHSGRGRLGKSVEVPKVSLKDVFLKNKLERIDFLKMDCEGAEFPILLNAEKDDLRKIKKIALEYHDVFTQHTHPEIEELLRSTGFEYKTIPMNYQDGIMYAWRNN